MRFSVLPAQLSPIAIDVGASTIKMLQITTGEAPRIHALAEIEVPEPIRGDHEKRFEFMRQEIPAAVRGHGFKGRRVVCAPTSTQVLVQSIQVDRVSDAPELAAAQLEAQLECQPGSLVVRAAEITKGNRDGRAHTEMLCWAMAREDSMRYVEMFNSVRCRLVGIHPQVRSVVSAFDHLNRRLADADICTMYVDLGWGGMKVAVAHGTDMVFAKQVQIGGRQFDGLVSESNACDMVTARIRRVEEGISFDRAPFPAARERTAPTGGIAMIRSGTPRLHGGDPGGSVVTDVAMERRKGVTPAEFANHVPPGPDRVLAAGVDCSEIVESMSDELSMCARYHGSLFGGRRIDRVVFLGGEARSTLLCRRLAESLNVPAQLGDPIARFADGPDDPRLPEPGRSAPGWASACGLCTSPVDF